MQQEYFYDMLKNKPLLFKKLVAKYNDSFKKHSYAEIKSDFDNFDFLTDQYDIINYLDLDDFNFSWEYTSNEKICTLLTRKELKKLAYYFGTCMHAKEISLIIKKEELLSIKEQIGKELYVYALEKGQYRVQNLAQIFSTFNQDLTLLEKIKLHGQEALAILSKDWPEQDKEKLPKLSNNACPEIQNFSEKQQNSLIFALKKILIKDITSEWQQCLD